MGATNSFFIYYLTTFMCNTRGVSINSKSEKYLFESSSAHFEA